MSIPFTWVYLIHDPFTGLYKIGKSDDPVKRCRDLSRQPTILAAPSDYELLQAWLAPENMEDIMHEKFHEHRRHGEWFELDQSSVDRMHQLLSWYRRWDGNAPQCSDDAYAYAERVRWYSAALIRASEDFKKLIAERDSLKRQRNYLVRQRDETAQYNEPREEQFLLTESVQ